MCRYIEHCYPEHFACIPCRRAFKGDFDTVGGRRCPECGVEATPMGRDFKPPRKRNRNQWRKVELLIAQGITFTSCGCHGPGPRPRTLADAKRGTT